LLGDGTVGENELTKKEAQGRKEEGQHEVSGLHTILEQGKLVDNTLKIKKKRKRGTGEFFERIERGRGGDASITVRVREKVAVKER